MRATLAALLALTLALTLPASAATDPPASAPQAQAGVVDINRASLDELKALKGIGDVRAAAIVKGRPYARKDELVRRGIVPQAVYDEIREQIIARQ
jgi:DNA uptake protein ComE-like DNA-binding protein